MEVASGRLSVDPTQTLSMTVAWRAVGVKVKLQILLIPSGIERRSVRSGLSSAACEWISRNLD